MLIILSGLPGTGKTTIARQLAHELAAVYLRIDSIEQSIRAAGRPVEGEGYSVALFDLSAADLINCCLHETKQLSFVFEEFWKR